MESLEQQQSIRTTHKKQHIAETCTLAESMLALKQLYIHIILDKNGIVARRFFLLVYKAFETPYAQCRFVHLSTELLYLYWAVICKVYTANTRLIRGL